MSCGDHVTTYISEGEELDDEAIERRRAMIREKAKKRALEDVRTIMTL